MILRLTPRRRFPSPFIALSLRRLSSSLPNITEDVGRSIHPTAIVHPDAVIGKGVSVGPFCTVGSSAKLGNGCKLYPSSHVFGNTELGDSCVVMIGAVVGDDDLPGYTVVGCNNVIGHHAVVGVKCQDMKYKAGDDFFLHIGDNNEIREFCSIHRSSKPTDKTVWRWLLTDMSKISSLYEVCSYSLFVKQDYTHTAGATVVHQFCHIGSFSFIGGGSVVSQDVPKYMMVTGERAEIRGLNLEGLRRSEFTISEIRSLRRAYRKIFISGDAVSLGMEERLAKTEQDKDLYGVPVVREMVQSIRDSFSENRRGISKFRHWSGS
ncbi:PREDICTED: probable acyl-[acyl-carrier-protein]--UDP-N-acetylglucosamine O-acyltransferase, mitochondrial isoform X4 [Tarenaya hassleriana]|uniref:probable acyl-[acyl-carrier-protein]--UDP-N-acetylglucosamine O-acyltransferase, mitochondrial isoform X4 n=1 Tax=Tarenaya hassleriana TaxID=28532 RepID=UPI00053C3777|nr:PREDICTED: probable acyl-[acyl-carrier-protein]--UDP-N-acetylglucosamine O-acyltransferase, mitochondrial isoform X4 [Tarenaya hassleriana]